jgi:hypothetical protein
MKPEHEELPTGKSILREFDDAGQLTSETHGYGMLDIALKVDFDEGTKTEETYFVKRRLVSRSRYEKERLDYPDMPAADNSLQDWAVDLLKAAERERREQCKAAKNHTPDPAAARQIDAFCAEMMGRGEREAAVAWIESPQHTLGELDHAASRRLVAKFARLGCKEIHACEIDHYEDLANTGHLVVELPDQPNQRKAVFREISRLAELQGYSGDFDDGQRYAYVKLD